MQFEAAIEDGDGVVVLLLTEKEVTCGVDGLFGDGVVFELSCVGGESLRAVVDGVVDEAHVGRVVGVVFDPVECGVVAPDGIADDGGCDGEAV